MFGCCSILNLFKVNPEISTLSNYLGISTEVRDNYIDRQLVVLGSFS